MSSHARLSQPFLSGASSQCGPAVYRLSLHARPLRALTSQAAPTHDKNAIKVVGNYKGLFFSSQAELGYVPRDIAEALTQTGLLTATSARLKYISVTDRGADVEFEVVGPKTHKKAFDAFLEKKLNEAPISDEQKEFAAFFDLKLPKGATFRQAKAEIGHSRVNHQLVVDRILEAHPNLERVE